MKNKIVVLMFIVTICGCSFFRPESGTSGIGMGMSKKEVVEKMKTRGTLVSESRDQLVYECEEGRDKLLVIRTFIFHNDTLVMTKEQEQ